MSKNKSETRRPKAEGGGTFPPPTLRAISGDRQSRQRLGLRRQSAAATALSRPQNGNEPTEQFSSARKRRGAPLPAAVHDGFVFAKTPANAKRLACGGFSTACVRTTVFLARGRGVRAKAAEGRRTPRRWRVYEAPRQREAYGARWLCHHFRADDSSSWPWRHRARKSGGKHAVLQTLRACGIQRNSRQRVVLACIQVHSIRISDFGRRISIGRFIEMNAPLSPSKAEVRKTMKVLRKIPLAVRITESQELCARLKAQLQSAHTILFFAPLAETNWMSAQLMEKFLHGKKVCALPAFDAAAKRYSARRVKTWKNGHRHGQIRRFRADGRLRNQYSLDRLTWCWYPVWRLT